MVGAAMMEELLAGRRLATLRWPVAIARLVGVGGLLYAVEATSSGPGPRAKVLAVAIERGHGSLSPDAGYPEHAGDQVTAGLHHVHVLSPTP